MQRVRAAALAGLAVVGSAACSGGSTGPTYPSIAGTYNATYQVEASTNGPPTLVDNLGAIAGTITLSGASSNGDFSGSYIAGNTSGVITGQEQTDGGVQISQFGNPNESAAAVPDRRPTDVT